MTGSAGAEGGQVGKVDLEGWEDGDGGRVTIRLSNWHKAYCCKEAKGGDGEFNQYALSQQSALSLTCVCVCRCVCLVDEKYKL